MQLIIQFKIERSATTSQNYHEPFIIDSHHRIDDTVIKKDLNNEKPDEMIPNRPTVQERDYYLPPVFTADDNEDEEDDDDTAYLDYDYEIKESNYKDSPDLVTVRTDTHDVPVVDDKIPLHTAKDNLPIFLLEPENTYVVKNKPATLKCRAANALKVSFYRVLVFYYLIRVFLL